MTVAQSIEQKITFLKNSAFLKDHAALQQQMDAFDKKVHSDFYTVVVLGEFKRGKSSFVNALLGKELLPTDVLPETATIHLLLYAQEPRAEVVYKDGHKENGEVSAEFLHRFSATNTKSIADQVNYIKIGYPIELLKNHIVLVDTPGVADLDDLRADVTYSFLPAANAVIFLLDANTPLTKTEKDFIESKIIPQGIQQIIFLVNKYDEVDEEEDEDFLEQVELRLRKTFHMGMPDAKLKEIQLYPLSARMAMRGIEERNEELLEASGLPFVQAAIERNLEKGEIARRKLEHAEAYLRQFDLRLQRAVSNDIAILQADLTELSHLAKQIQSERASYQAQEAEIHDYTERIRENIEAMTDKSIDYFGKNLSEDIHEQIELYKGSEFKDFIEKQMAKRIQKSVEGWLYHNAPSVNLLVKQLEQQLAAGLSRSFNQKIQLRSHHAQGMEKEDVRFSVEVADIGNVTLQAGAIAAAGSIGLMAIVGSSIMPLISFAALPYLRSYMLKKKLSEAKLDVAPAIERQLHKVVAQLKAEMHDHIAKQCHAVEENSRAAFDMLLQEIEQKIDAARKEQETQAAGKQEKLQALQAFQKEAHTLLNS